jgi:branched-chain amino acid transport system substrate-binding protein
MFVVGILLGEPEYIDPLKPMAPEGMLVTGYPWYDIDAAAHKDFVRASPRSYDHNPVLGSLVGYITYLSIFEAHPQGGLDRHRQARRRRSAGSRSRRRSGRSVISRAPTGSRRWARGSGTTKVDAKRGVGIMVNHEYVSGEKVLPSDDEVKKMRSGN